MLRRSILLIALLHGAALADPLGTGELAVTGAPVARAHFERGLLALHSFWYDEALREFRASTSADPRFLMGYWGEAMALNHPVWGEQETEAARAVLARVPRDAQATPRERAWLDTLAVLYGSGDKSARDRAYAEACEKLAQAYPDDEATLFHALALLGAAPAGPAGEAMRVRAGALAIDVLAHAPNHPGAAHYAIHAFDDPTHAVLGLPAARRYAAIAPGSVHARHMPAHIFVQLGMWPEAQAACESAWDLAVQQNAGRGDFHSYTWLISIYLQRGMLARAEKALVDTREAVKKRHNARLGGAYADAVAGFISETGAWDRLPEFLPALAPPWDPLSGAGPAPEAAAACAHAPASPVRAAPPFEQLVAAEGAYLQGMAAARARRFDDSAARLAELRGIAEKLGPSSEGNDARAVEALALQVEGRLAAARGNLDAALEALSRSTALEERLEYPGPRFVPPAGELRGDLLLEARRFADAAQAYRSVLVRSPHRPRALLGLLRASRGTGDVATARSAAAELSAIWRNADARYPGLEEARTANR